MYRGASHVQEIKGSAEILMEMLPREAKEAKTEQRGLMWGNCKERPTVNLLVPLSEAESCSRQAMEDLKREGMSGLTEINIIKHMEADAPKTTRRSAAFGTRRCAAASTDLE